MRNEPVPSSAAEALEAAGVRTRAPTTPPS